MGCQNVINLKSGQIFKAMHNITFFKTCFCLKQPNNLQYLINTKIINGV